MLIVRALLVSTYELGRQPFGLASPAAWLRSEGVEVRCVDAAKERLADAEILAADFVAFHLPMHTATRLAGPIIRKVRDLNRSARLCAYGLYAPLNGEWLRSLGVDDVLGGEFEADLARIALAIRPASDAGVGGFPPGRREDLPRLKFLVPDRSGLPPLTRYATLQMGDGTSRLAGYTEASRGCRHLCRHCPVVPVYQGQFRIVQPDVVLADVDAQVAAGARHITFGDPDFLNGPAHAKRIVAALAARHPSVTYDVTIKIEHLLRHPEFIAELRQTGCLFVTSAVESLDDRVLAILEKGHTRADFLAAVDLCRRGGLMLVPTFVPFHPWTTLAGYCDLLDTLEGLGLVDHVAAIQLSIRLLIPEGSRLLENDEVRELIGPFDRNTLSYPWGHPDPEIDRLQAEITALVGGQLSAERRRQFDRISTLAHDRAGLRRPDPAPSSASAAPLPFMNEPWYCCAEPNPEQLRVL